MTLNALEACLAHQNTTEKHSYHDAVYLLCNINSSDDSQNLRYTDQLLSGATL